MLGRLNTLIMSCCQQITDVSKLGGLHTLIMRFCKNIKKYPEPNNITKYIR